MSRSLLLASSSPHRRAQLERLGLAFEWMAPGVDETPRPGEAPEALVRRLSAAKARAARPAEPATVVVAGDQLAVDGERLVGKPGDRAAAVEQLAASAGRTLRFLSGCAVLDVATGQLAVEVVPTDVTFRPLTRREIEAYVDADTPFDCAGSFRSEGLGIVLFERIVSADPSALTGLPLIALARMLREAGLDPLSPE